MISFKTFVVEETYFQELTEAKDDATKVGITSIKFTKICRKGSVI